MHRTSLPAHTCLAMGIAFYSSPAVAAIPVYFDIGGLIPYVLGIILGFLVFPLCMAFSKSKTNKRIFGWLSVACIAALARPFVSDYWQERQFKHGLLENADAFAKYCTSGRQPVLHPELATSPVAISVRHESVASKPAWIGGADRLVQRIQSDQSFCSRSGITTISPVNPAPREKAYYSICAAAGAASAIPVEYELLVRDSYESKKATGAAPWETVMYKSSLVLTRKADKQIVAEGDFYFVGPPFVQITARCRKTDEAILQFLVAAIPKG